MASPVHYCSDDSFEYEDTDAFSDGGSSSEDDLVFFLSDSDDEEETGLNETVAPIVPHVIKQLSPETVEKMKVLDGKMSWANKEFTPRKIERKDEDEENFPPVSRRRMKRDLVVLKPVPQSYCPMSVPVKVVNKGVGSHISFWKPNESHHRAKKGTLCKFFFDTKTCKYGAGCIFSHVIPLCHTVNEGKICHKGNMCKYMHIPICPEYPRCRTNKCNLFHPKKEEMQKMRRLKLTYCRNVLRDGKCPNGSQCMFAHTKEEIKNYVVDCPYRANCTLVKVCAINKAGRTITMYKNVFYGRCCRRLHPKEQINNFIIRTSRDAGVLKDRRASMKDK